MIDLYPGKASEVSSVNSIVYLNSIVYIDSKISENTPADELTI